MPDAVLIPGEMRAVRHAGLLASVLKATAWLVRQPGALRLLAFALVAPFPLASPVQTLPSSPL